MSRAKKLGILAIALLFLGMAYQNDKRRAELAARTPEQVASDEREAQLERKRQRTAELATSLLKNSLRDPDSFTLETVGVSDDAGVVCIAYRAKNGFGGMNREYVTLLGAKSYRNDPGVWNKNCLQSLRDYRKNLN